MCRGRAGQANVDSRCICVLQTLGKRHSHQNSIMLLLLGNAGLFMVDHIHFQYNGFLSGVLLLSISAIASHNFILAGLLFSALLMLKHIYLYMAPAYIVFMLRSYCFKTNSSGTTSWSSFSPVRLILLGLSVLVNVGLAMGPFILSGESLLIIPRLTMFSPDNLHHVISRLFPFKRGLCHAYWAPNFWAVYNTVDKVLAVGARYGGFHTEVAAGSMTGGLVQDIQHSVLPNISPLATASLTILAWLPALVKLWTSPSNTNQFVRSLALCAWTSFLFGWHVHEKAILLVILPMTLLGSTNKQDARWFSLIATVGHLSLFPLLFTSPELISKLLLHIAFLLVMFETVTTSLSLGEKLYLSLSVPVVIFCEFITIESLPFLPLLIYSLYCASGVIYTYIRFYVHFLSY